MEKIVGISFDLRFMLMIVCSLSLRVQKQSI